MIQFESCEALTGKVRERLRSFDQAGLVDEGLFYSTIKNGLNDLGLVVQQPAEVILHPQHGKVRFPEDMTDFWSIYRLRADSKPNLQIAPSKRTYVVEREICDYKETDCCTLFSDGQIIKETIQIPGEVFVERSYHCLGLLSFNSSGLFRPGSVIRQRCDSGSPCRTHRSSAEFSHDQHYFHFNFESDPVLLQYYAFPTDELGLPMVVTEPVVQQFLEHKLVYETLRDIWLNNEVSDLERRLQLVREELALAERDARQWTKVPSFKRLAEWKAKQRGRYNIFELRRFRY